MTPAMLSPSAGLMATPQLFGSLVNEELLIDIYIEGARQYIAQKSTEIDPSHMEKLTDFGGAVMAELFKMASEDLDEVQAGRQGEIVTVLTSGQVASDVTQAEAEAAVKVVEAVRILFFPLQPGTFFDLQFQARKFQENRFTGWLAGPTPLTNRSLSDDDFVESMMIDFDRLPTKKGTPIHWGRWWTLDGTFKKLVLTRQAIWDLTEAADDLIESILSIKQ